MLRMPTRTIAQLGMAAWPKHVLMLENLMDRKTPMQKPLDTRDA